MPNWVSTELRVTGPAAEIARFKENARESEDNPLSTDMLYPVPEDLQGTRSPAKIVSQEEYELEKKRLEAGDLTPEEKTFGLGRAITQEMSDRFKEKYGADNWYDWSNEHWGTKWGFCDSAIYIEDDEELRYGYQTAWGPAGKAWEKISADYPELRFDTLMFEESNEFNGRMDYMAGGLINEEILGNILTDYEMEAIGEIIELTQEDAIKCYTDYEDEFGYSDRVMDAIKARMAGDEVEQPKDEIEHLRF